MDVDEAAGLSRSVDLGSNTDVNPTPAHDYPELAEVLGEHRLKLLECLRRWTHEQEHILERVRKEVAGSVPSHREKALIRDDLGTTTSPKARKPNNGTAHAASAEDVATATKSTKSAQVVDSGPLDSWDRTKTSDSETSIPAGSQQPSIDTKSTHISRQSEKSQACSSSRGTAAQIRAVVLGGSRLSGARSSATSDDAAEVLTGKFDMQAQLRTLNFQRRSARTSKGNLLAESACTTSTSLQVSRIIAPAVNNPKFDSLCSVVILLNAIVMGISADYGIASPHEPDVPVLELLELLFCIFYILEVFFRILVHGCDYFCGPGWSWNWFDVLLVVQSVYDQAQNRILGSMNQGQVNNFSFLRMLRLMKMLRLLRIIRLMKMFKELRMMLFSMLGSMKAMVWACVLMAMISYMFGICVLQGCSLYLQGGGTENVDKIELYWSSLGTAMLSLFKASTSGLNWHDLAKPLENVGIFFYALFVTYIAFFTFVVVNTLTSIFVEVTMENSEKDNQMVIQLELEKKNMYMNRLQDFWDSMHNDENGCITYEDFCKHLQNPKMMAFASSLDLDVLNAKQFFFMLSENGTRPVDVETFVVGCIKLKGLAKNMDLMDLIYSFKKSQSDQKDHVKEIKTALESMKKTLIEARIAQRFNKIESALRNAPLSNGSDANHLTDDQFSSERPALNVKFGL